MEIQDLPDLRLCAYPACGLVAPNTDYKVRGLIFCWQHRWGMPDREAETRLKAERKVLDEITEEDRWGVPNRRLEVGWVRKI